MREIEGLLTDGVNTYQSKRTTHIRLLLKTKRKIQEEAKKDNLTIPEYMERIIDRKPLNADDL